MGKATSYRDGVCLGVRAQSVQKTHRYTNKTDDGILLFK